MKYVKNAEASIRNQKRIMNNIPQRLRKEMAADPYYEKCARKELLDDHNCEACPLTGKLIEWEHVFYWAGRQLQEKWAIIPICYLVHRGGMLDKTINEWIALNRATEEELKAISKSVDYLHKKKYLNEKYGN